MLPSPCLGRTPPPAPIPATSTLDLHPSDSEDRQPSLIFTLLFLPPAIDLPFPKIRQHQSPPASPASLGAANPTASTRRSPEIHRPKPSSHQPPTTLLLVPCNQATKIPRRLPVAIRADPRHPATWTPSRLPTPSSTGGSLTSSTKASSKRPDINPLRARPFAAVILLSDFDPLRPSPLPFPCGKQNRALPR